MHLHKYSTLPLPREFGCEQLSLACGSSSPINGFAGTRLPLAARPVSGDISSVSQDGQSSRRYPLEPFLKFKLILDTVVFKPPPPNNMSRL